MKAIELLKKSNTDRRRRNDRRRRERDDKRKFPDPTENLERSAKKILNPSQIGKNKKTEAVVHHTESPILNDLNIDDETKLEELKKRQLLEKYPSFAMSKFKQYDNGLFPQVAYSILADGRTIHSVMAELGIPQTRFNSWVKKYRDFREAVELGLLMSYHWWLEIGRMNVNNNRFNNVLYESQMRNRFKWIEKNVSADSVAGTINIINSLEINENKEKGIDLDKLSYDDLKNLRGLIQKSTGDGDNYLTKNNIIDAEEVSEKGE